MSEQIPNIPLLPTLSQAPSWLNFRGGIDRSACIEVGIAEVRELAGCSTYFFSKTGRKTRIPGDTNPLPNQVAAINRHGRVATGIFEIRAVQLHDLHQQRKPRRLAGDHRSARANVMRKDTEAVGCQLSAVSQEERASTKPTADSRKPLAFPSA